MPEVFSIIIFVFVSYLGAIMSSFYSATIMRETSQTKASGERSHCDSCGKQLVWWELVPLLSFIFLRGKCSKCGKQIDVRMFLAEVIGTVLFAIFAVFVNMTLLYSNLAIWPVIVLVIQFITLNFFLYLSIYDIFTYSIPTKVTNWLVVFSIAVNSFILVFSLSFRGQLAEAGIDSLGGLSNLIAGLVGGGFVYALILITKQKGIGSGDMYLAIVLGLMLGWPGIVSAFYVIVLSASAIGLIYAAIKKQYKGLIVPLVPFIALGYVAGVTWGAEIFSLLFFSIS